MDFGIKEIRQKILHKQGPFLTADLFHEFNALNSDDRKLIIQTMNDMYSEGLIVYDRYTSISNAQIDNKYMFSVV